MDTFLLNPSGLALLNTMGTPFSIFLSPVVEDEKPYWLVAIKLHESNETGYLSNTRGEMRFFKDVNTALDLIKKYCPKFNNVELAVLAVESIYEQT